MAEKKKVLGKIIVKNARLAFPALYEPDEQLNDNGEKSLSWKSSLLIDKEEWEDGTAQAVFDGKTMPLSEAVKKASAEVKTDKWGPKAKWPKIPRHKTFLQNGDEKEYDGYPGNWVLSARAKFEDKPAVVTNRKNKDGWIHAEPGGKGSPYAGCYVNAVLIVWAQDSKYGKRVNAQLRSVQFVSDGEPFSAVRSDPNDDFTDDMVGEEGDLDDEGDIIDDDDDDDNLI